MADILVVDDEQSIATAFEQFLRDEGHQCRIASDVEDGLRLIEAQEPDIVFMDVRMPGRDGVQGLQEIRSRFPAVHVVMMTAYGTSQTSIDAIRAGAFDYLTKPLDLGQLRSAIAQALAARQARDAAKSGEESDRWLPPGVRLIGDTPAIQEVYKLIGRLATTDVPALILGERGTGKQLVARTIHENSARHAEPFAAYECESTPDTELERLMAGTGGGSVYLDGIEAMPAALQSKLSQMIATGTMKGGPSARPPRVFAGSERDVAELARSGALRRELYDVLSVITIRMPALRDRRDDIPALVRYFIQRFNDELSRNIQGVDDAVLRRLRDHAWPGNVGELERVVKRACIVAQSDVITASEIAGSLEDSRFDPKDVESALQAAVRITLRERLVERSAGKSATPFHDIVDLVESTLVQESLIITNGNQVKAADILGVNRATLRKKIPE